MLVAMVVLVATAPATASGRRYSQPGASCGNHASAINQYCEDIPSATGDRSSITPAPAQARIGASLPQAVGHRTPGKLSALPARVRVALIGPPASGSSLPVLLLVMMVVVALAALAAVIARKRRAS